MSSSPTHALKSSSPAARRRVFGLTTRSSSAVGNRHAFTGRPFDWETGLYDFRLRSYDAATGRFTTRDALGTWADKINLGSAYALAGNDPVNSVDPSGAQSFPSSRSRFVQMCPSKMHPAPPSSVRIRASRRPCSPADPRPFLVGTPGVEAVLAEHADRDRATSLPVSDIALVDRMAAVSLRQAAEAISAGHGAS